VLDYRGSPGPRTVVAKFASRDPDSAAAGIATKTYETEVAFYRELADTVDVSRPTCYFAAIQPGTAEVVLVLEDLAPAEQGDQIAGCTVAEAELAVDEAARLHGPRWDDPALAEADWLQRSDAAQLLGMLPAMWAAFVERYQASLEPVALAEGERVVASAPVLFAHQPAATTVVHNDFRLDNMLFGPPGDGRPVTVVDWQTVRRGLGPQDVAYFLGNAFEADVRRACEERLVARYHDGLLGYGISGYALEQCWDDYRRSSYASLLMAIFASILVGRTERGDAMFMAMANRSAQMAADLDAASFLTPASC
jgi:hypothetical protein